MNNMGAKLTVIAATGALVLTGCAGGDDAEEVSPTETSVTADSTPSTPEPTPSEPAETEGDNEAAAAGFCADYAEVRDFAMSPDGLDSADLDGTLSSLSETRATLAALDVDGDVGDARDTVVESLDTFAGAIEELSAVIPEGVDIANPDYESLTDEEMEALANFDATAYMEAITEATGPQFVEAANELDAYAAETCG